MPRRSPPLHWISRAAVTPGSIFCRSERPRAERRSAARHFRTQGDAHRPAMRNASPAQRHQHCGVLRPGTFTPGVPRTSASDIRPPVLGRRLPRSRVLASRQDPRPPAAHPGESPHLRRHAPPPAAHQIHHAVARAGESPNLATSAAHPGESPNPPSPTPPRRLAKTHHRRRASWRLAKIGDRKGHGDPPCRGWRKRIAQVRASRRHSAAQAVRSAA